MPGNGQNGHSVPVVTVTDMKMLEDEDEFVAMLEEKMLEANCGIIKVSLVVTNCFTVFLLFR